MALFAAPSQADAIDSDNIDALVDAYVNYDDPDDGEGMFMFNNVVVLVLYLYSYLCLYQKHALNHTHV